MRRFLSLTRHRKSKGISLGPVQVIWWGGFTGDWEWGVLRLEKTSHYYLSLGKLELSIGVTNEDSSFS